MKKIFSILLILAMLLAVCSGCTVSVATRKSRIVGTYKLTSMTDYDGDDVTKKGIEAYLVVPNEGYGYYVYKDDENRQFMRAEMLVVFKLAKKK